MNARQFYDLVVELRKAQKQAATTLKYEEIERVFYLEGLVDKEIERVTTILNQRNNNEQHQHRNEQHPNPR